ncbi:MAG: hypothetical protein QQN43_04965 [Nitrosopumilus sp.]|nr:hypothetical protein [Nitrososphaerota archaeon]
MTGLFDEKENRIREIVDREEILQTAFEYWEAEKSFKEFLRDAMDFLDISEKDVRKILSGEITKIKANPYDI